MKILTPLIAADVIVERGEQILLIKRKNEPLGWALPGGFMEVGETIEQTAVRELQEETGLSVKLLTLLYVYSHPSRDIRGHSVSAVFIGTGSGTLQADDDAIEAKYFLPNQLPDLAFDHKSIIADYLIFKKTGKYPEPSKKLPVTP